jgi:hypothetical protein
VRNIKHLNDVRGKIEVSIRCKKPNIQSKSKGTFDNNKASYIKKIVSGAFSDNLVQREDSFSAFSISKKV